MSEIPFNKLKGDERQFRIESAARTLKEYAALLRDKKLLNAAREQLKIEISDSQKALKKT